MATARKREWLEASPAVFCILAWETEATKVCVCEWVREKENTLISMQCIDEQAARYRWWEAIDIVCYISVCLGPKRSHKAAHLTKNNPLLSVQRGKQKVLQLEEKQCYKNSIPKLLPGRLHCGVSRNQTQTSFHRRGNLEPGEKLSESLDHFYIPNPNH